MKPTKTLYQSQRTRQRQKRKKTWIAAAVVLLIALSAAALWYFGVFEALGAALAPAPSPTPAQPTAPAPTPVPPPESPAPAAEPTAMPGESASPAPAEAPETGLPLYELAAAIDDEDRMRATLRISYPNATGETLYELVLRIYPNFTAPGSLQVNAAAVDGTLAQHILNPEGTLLTVPMDALPPGERCTLLLEYTFDIPDSQTRCGKARGHYQMGNFIPTLAVYENGAWDTRPFSSIGDPFYSGLADYKVAFSRPAYYDSFAGTGEVMEVQPGQEQTVTYAAAGAVRDFALVASGRLASATETAACGVTVTGWAESSGDARRNARMGAQAADVFSELIGPCPHDAIEIVETSITEGGMEYPGMIMVDRSLYDDGKSLSLEATIAHEVAHQWFYDAVGSDQIGAPWLDESLVNYLGILYFNKLGEDADYERLLTTSTSDTAGLGWPVDGSLYDYPDSEAYAQAVYQRGAFLFYALRETIGPEAFEDGVQAYYRDNAGKTAGKADLIAAFSYAAERDLTEWFEGWLGAT